MVVLVADDTVGTSYPASAPTVTVSRIPATWSVNTAGWASLAVTVTSRVASTKLVAVTRTV